MNIAERKIKGALMQAAELHRGGTDPNVACTKAASFHELNPEMTKRLVEGFNIGKTNTTIAKAADKTASFPIADVNEVIKATFVDAPIGKEAAVVPMAKVASGNTEYQETSPDVTFDFTNGQKVAAPLGDFNHHIRQMNGLMEAHAHDLSKIAQEVIFNEDKMTAALQGLVDYFSCSNNVGKLAEFECDVLSEYGEGVRETLNIIYELSGNKEARFEGSVKLGSVNVQHQEPHSLFDTLIAATNGYFEACTQHGAKLAEALQEKAGLQTLVNEVYEIPDPAAKTAADFISGSFKSGGSTPPPLSKKADDGAETPAQQKERHYQDSLDRDSIAKNKELISNVGAGTLGGISNASKNIGGILSTIAGKHPTVSGALSGEQSALSDQYAKAHSKALEDHYRGPVERADAEMANVKRQAILMDMIHNDDIISKQDPKQVQAVYNTLLGIAPDLTLHPEVVRSFLRSSTAQQSVDPFTVGQVATTQQALLKNKMLTKGQAMPAGA